MSNLEHNKSEEDEMRPHYDFSQSKPAPWVADKRPGTVIQLDSDLTKHFHTSEEVNKALRELLKRRAAS